VPAADGAFVSLVQLLRPEHTPEIVAPPAAVQSTEPAPLPDVAELARDVRVFRARLADAFDVAGDALLHEFAYAVLGRELILAPADIATIAARVLAELAPGDAILDFTGSSVDARLGIRLAALLERST
jgi:hypothetical protein